MAQGKRPTKRGLRRGLRRGWAHALAALAAAATLAPAEARAAPFDLAGPKLEVRVTRAGRTLPIAETPNLAPGDQLAIKADLPPGQSARYILVAAFLRGATDPPPETWFARTATWIPSGRNGLHVTVPEGAQQALVFLAPQTGGDFKTLVAAVRGRPGAFVRSSQELNQASLDRSRLDAFLAGIGRTEPARLKTVSPLMARSLGMKFDTGCLQKVAEFQASCLTQDRDSLVLDDARNTSRLATLASGYSAELVRELSSAPWAGAGNYSPYIASLLDIVHLFDASRTAQYQYIPALVTESGEQVSLWLNAPPSFRNPKSVLVAALPPVQPAQPPEVHPVDPAASYCLGRPGLVLPVEGAPLLFAARYAHDLSIRLKTKDGRAVDLPARAEAERGGLVVDPAPAAGADLPGGTVQGQLVGAWGFDPYTGPSFRLTAARPQAWTAKGADRPALIAGQDSVIRLQGETGACVESVRLQQPTGAEAPLDWSLSAPDELTVRVPVALAAGESSRLLIRTFGRRDADVVNLGRYAPLPEVAGIEIHAGDHGVVLTGSRLDEVRSVTLAGASFVPPADAPPSKDRLELAAADPAPLAALHPGETVVGRADLADGRKLTLQTTVGPVRPRVNLMSKAVEPNADTPGMAIRLGGADAAPRRSRLTFSIQAEAPTVFTGRETLEIATAGGAFSTTLSASDGLTLQDPRVAVAALDLDKRFGPSAFGPLRFRVIQDGVATEWRPLVTLVRLPQIDALACHAGASQPCQLKGSNLFLIAAIARDPQFERPQHVPDGFPGDVLPAPRPQGGRLYLKLRDDPAAVDTLTVSGAKARKTAASAAKP